TARSGLTRGPVLVSFAEFPYHREFVRHGATVSADSGRECLDRLGDPYPSRLERLTASRRRIRFHFAAMSKFDVEQFSGATSVCVTRQASI
ncbi:MAG: hypothetical protein JWP08_3239, partial [Bryobacterales bacterium]|nr:hypothetical protein [Bryobacterales bacterium]